MKLEHKTISFSVKALDDDQGLIEAYGSVFDVEDQGGDVVQPGAFKRTIQNSKARKEAGKAKFLATMLYQHDPDRPIGGWYDLVEDTHGLKCKGQIVLSTQLGRETYELIKAGVINEFSIGYDIPSGGSTYDKSSGARLLKELRLWEISPVTFAMNQEALLTSVKTVMTEKQRKDFNDHYRQESITDWLYSDFNNLVNALKQSLIDEFMIGDEPEQDTVTTILNDSSENKMGFISALKAWVQKGIDLDASNYLQEQNGVSQSRYYMSNDKVDNMYTKDGRTISKATSDKLQAHIDNIRNMADEHKKAMNEHIKAMHSAADDLATMLQGSEAAYGTDEGKPETGQEGKAAPYTGTRGAQSHPLDNSTVDENELENALSILRSLHK
jgi:HK97 family phage prohead protease